ncbi:MAG: universal stress protein [Chloroflexi bacterium]|nr:universal stress protein [Chloroflexota bacterium]
MFAKILIPLDESTQAEQVLPCALAIARRMRSEVTLLCAVPSIQQNEVTDDGHLIDMDELMEIAQREAREYLNAIAGPLHAEGISVKTALETGIPAECILDFAQSMDVDLIAMSTRGRSGVGRWVFGSVADRVLRHATCPVLLTRSGPPMRGDASIQRVLLPLDGSPLAELAVPPAVQLARAFGAEIVLTRVITLPPAIYGTPEAMPLVVEEPGDEKQATEYLQSWRTRLEADGVRTHIVVSRPPVAEALLDMVRGQQANLIVMSTHGRSGVRRWVYGSVADRVLHSTPVPILLLRATDDKASTVEVSSAATYP